MPISPYLRRLREKVGSDLLLLPAVAVIVRNPIGGLLFVRDRESGTWGLPAGSVEPTESPSEAARRELKEECGIECRDLELIAGLGGEGFRHTYPNGHVVEYSIFVFAGIVPENLLALPQDGNEVAEARFFSREEAPVLSLPYPEEILWAGSV